ncbi:MAG: ParB/RepB/Spo0J family partition protein [Roseovarius sp.]
MAKRKRLSVANPGYAGDIPPLEVKSMPIGKAPIAGVAADAATSAALDEVAAELRDARREGRMIIELPLAAVDVDYLVRDRIVEDDEALQALIASLDARGQQVPVEVTDLGDGRYGLISGWRRCQALAQLGHTNVNAILRTLHEASDAYLAMIEENEIRAGLSYYERARIVVRATEQEVFADERSALRTLFQSGSRARRSKIGTFMHIVHALDGALRFPGAIPERAGLELGRALQGNPKLDLRIVDALARKAPEAAESELECVMAVVNEIGSNKENSESKSNVPDVTPCVGIKVKTHKNGSLTLSGKNVDADFRESLLGWLQAQN